MARIAKENKLILIVGCLIFLNQLGVYAQSRASKLDDEILIDGKFDLNAWDKATKIELADSAEIYIARKSGYLLLCFRSLRSRHDLGGIDLNIFCDGVITNFHASAQLGERAFEKGRFVDFVWWNNKDWYANPARLNPSNGKIDFLRDECKEFQIALSRFSSNQIKIHFSVTTPKNRYRNFPPNSVPEDPGLWYELVIN